MRFPRHSDSDCRVPDTGGADSARLRTVPGWSLKRLVFLCLLTLTLFFLPLNAAAQETSKKVLILTGSDPNYHGFSAMTRNIVSTLRGGSRSHIEVLYEIQRTLVEPPELQGSDEDLASYLKRKYADTKLDLLLVIVA